MKEIAVNTATFVKYAGVIFFPNRCKLSFALIFASYKNAPTHVGAKKGNKPTFCFIRTVPSVQEPPLLNPRGFVDYTTGGEFHPALKCI